MARCFISQRWSAGGYDRFYREFDSPLMRQIRREAYGDDIGQHSWVTEQDVQSVVAELRLPNASRVLDLGCGAGGVLAFVAGKTGCHGTGIDVSAPAIVAAQKRASSLGLDAKLSFREADLNKPLRFPEASFEAAISLDVIVHLRDRAAVFREVRRVLVPGGRFLFTDAGIVTGLVSADEFRVRASPGYTQFIPPGFNEHALQQAGFQVLDVADGTTSLLHNAKGRLSARRAHALKLKDVEGCTNFDVEQQYLATVVELAERRALSRMTYMAQAGAA
jgi:SAM-dependent methyltransferase